MVTIAFFNLEEVFPSLNCVPHPVTVAVLSSYLYGSKLDDDGKQIGLMKNVNSIYGIFNSAAS